MQNFTRPIKIHTRLWAQMLSGSIGRCAPVIPLTGALRQKTLLSGSLQ